jgi:hypothetical protein
MTVGRRRAKPWGRYVAFLAVIIPSIAGATTRAPTPTTTPVLTLGRNVCGQVAYDCTAPFAGATILLDGVPTGTLTDADGSFCVEGVASGDHLVSVSPGCVNIHDCFAPLPVTVGASDVAIDLCGRRCELGEFHFVPTAGAPGTEVEVWGWCQCVHSGASAPLYFDDTVVGRVRGDTGGCFWTRVEIPLRAAAGPHQIHVPLIRSDAADTFRVWSLPDGCAGDCSDDAVVRIDELLRGVGIALETRALDSCPAFDRNGDGKVTVDELMLGVGNTLAGCPALLTPESLAATYDAVVSFTGGSELTGLGIIQASFGELVIEVHFNLLSSIHVQGVLQPDRTVTLRGGRITGGDIYSQATGSARVDVQPNGERMSGTLAIDGFSSDPQTAVFELFRPASGTPTTFNGPYHVTLNHPSPSILNFSVELTARGIGTCRGADHLDESRINVLPPLPANPCAISPEGRFRFRTSYGDGEDPLAPPIVLFGTFTEATGMATGSGQFQVGLAPVVREQGTWSAERSN